MSIISVSLATDGTTADVADVNTPINTIVTLVNGNLDNDNIKAAAGIDGSKLASATIVNSKMNLSNTTDANGWSIISLGSVSLASKTYNYEAGSVAVDAVVNLGIVNAPVSGTILHRAWSSSIAGNATVFLLTRENDTMYLRNVAGGAADPNTIRVDFIYIMTA